MALMPSGTASASACANADLMPDAGNTVLIRAATRCLINEERVNAGRRKLTNNALLTNTAQAYAKQMVRDTFFDHVSPAGGTLLQRIKNLAGAYLKNTARWALGENLAWGTEDLATPASTVKAWMSSPGHRANILHKRFNNVGVGVAVGAPEHVEGRAATYTTVFGQRAKR